MVVGVPPNEKKRVVQDDVEDQMDPVPVNDTPTIRTNGGRRREDLADHQCQCIPAFTSILPDIQIMMDSCWPV